jgi:hypothetical protein
MSFSLRAAAVALAVLCVCVAAAGTAIASSARPHSGGKVISTRTTRPLQTGIFDPFHFDGLQQVQAFKMLHAAGGTYVRLVALWYRIAPTTLPSDFVASDPSSPGYNWSGLDATIAAAEAAGLTPILDVGAPPSWAIIHRTIRTGGGTPKLADLTDFAKAIATHYDGNHGASAVHVFQVWNEPNLSLDLSPTNPNTYRAMVNAFAGEVHAVNRANIVVAGALDPFGGKTKRYHTMSPLAFMRGFLCLSKGKKPKKTCHTPVHFDVWSHHPYTVHGPFGHAKQADDVSLGDLPKMNTLLKRAAKLHQIVSSKPVKFWVTEFSWDTGPPRHNAAPPRLEARWTAEAFHQMWLSGVSEVTWFMLQDEPGVNPYQSGLYFYKRKLAEAKAKPMRTSFRFPFTAYLGKKRGAVSVWGRDATSAPATVAIQQQHNSKGRWRTVARIHANRYGIFLANLKLRNVSAKDSLRASARGSGNSLAFSLTRPSGRLAFGPWGNP